MHRSEESGPAESLIEIAQAFGCSLGSVLKMIKLRVWFSSEQSVPRWLLTKSYKTGAHTCIHLGRAHFVTKLLLRDCLASCHFEICIHCPAERPLKLSSWDVVKPEQIYQVSSEVSRDLVCGLANGLMTSHGSLAGSREAPTFHAQ